MRVALIRLVIDFGGQIRLIRQAVNARFAARAEQRAVSQVEDRLSAFAAQEHRSTNAVRSAMMPRDADVPSRLKK